MHCSFEKDETTVHIIVNPEMQLLEVLQKIGAKRMEEFKPEFYCFYAYSSASTQRVFFFFIKPAKKQMDILKYSSMNNSSMLNINQSVKNLPTNELLVFLMISTVKSWLKKCLGIVLVEEGKLLLLIQELQLKH